MNDERGSSEDVRRQSEKLTRPSSWIHILMSYARTFRLGLFVFAVIVGLLISGAVGYLLTSLGVKLEQATDTSGLLFLGITTAIYGLVSSLQANRWSYLDSVVKYWHQLLDEASKECRYLVGGEVNCEDWGSLTASDKTRYAIVNLKCIDCMSIIMDYVQRLPNPDAKELEQAWRANFGAYMQSPLTAHLWNEDVFGVRSSMRPESRTFIESLLKH